MSIAASTPGVHWSPAPRWSWRITAVAAVALAILLAGYIGVRLGEDKASVRSLIGSGRSASGAISLKSGNWWYGVPLSVRWQSADGAWHEDGRPACLPPTGKVGPVKFGAVPVSRDGVGWRAVVWVSCRV